MPHLIPMQHFKNFCASLSFFLKKSQGRVLLSLICLLAVFWLSASVLATYYPVPLRREPALSANVVISQVYGGGGNSGAQYTHDFIEVFNRGTIGVNVTGWSVQYASTSGTSWSVFTLPSVTLAPGKYLLVQGGSNGAVGIALPTPDATGSTNMAAANGKVALVNSTTALTGSGCPFGATVIDFVGYGTANCSEGAAAAAGSNTTSIARNGQGCTETDVNSADFTSTNAPNPRNSATPANPCGGGMESLSLSCTPATFAENAGINVSTCTVTRTGSTAASLLVNLSSNDTTETTVSAPDVTILVGQPSATFMLNAVDDAIVDGTQNATITASAASFSNGTFQVMATDNDAGTTLIHDIQGTAETPNLNGTSVTIQGIVVGDFQTATGLTGFFVEEENADWDGDANTSEGIFVADPAAFVNVAIGDKVTVIGTVANTFGLTQITPTTSVTINASAQTLPNTQLLAFPFASTTELEKYEGMRVAFDTGQVISDTTELGRFGEFTISAPRVYTVTNSIDPNDNPASGTTNTGNTNVAAVTAQQSLNNRSKLIVDDGSNVTNTGGLAPIPFIGAGTSSTLRAGDVANGLVGVLSFGFSAYRLEVTAAPTFTTNNPRTAAPAAIGSGNVRVASFNVENYFLGPYPDPTGRGPSNATEFTRKRDKIAEALAALNADVIGLIELELAGGNAAAADIAAALTTRLGGGMNTYAAIADLGTLVGTDTEIKSSLIYRTSTVTTVGSPVTDTTAVAGTYSRDPVAQRFQHTASGQNFVVSVNHFRSRVCTGASGGDTDQGDGQGCFNPRRRGQATALGNFVNTTLAALSSRVIVVGDLNSYGEEDPLDTLRAAGMTDAIAQYVPAASRYSYNFNNEAGQLDHALVTASVASALTGATIWHINADEPGIFDYNTENKPDDRYAASPARSSDHDLVLLAFTVGCPTINVTPSTAPAGTAGSSYGPVNFMQSGGNGTITWSVSSNNLPAGLALDSMTGVLSGTPTVAVGVNIVVRATDANGCFGEVAVTLQINCPTITISPSTGPTTTLMSGTVGQSYSQTLMAAPAGGAYSYSIPLAAIPPGLSFNTSTGELSGTPTTTGTFVFTVTATGFGTCQGQQTYSLTVNCQTITITPVGPTLSDGNIGMAYSQQLTASNGSGTVNFTRPSGSLPLGLTMSLAGLISGTPTQAGTANFTVKATDANNCMTTQPYSITVTANCPSTLTVNDLGDAEDASSGNQLCATAGGACTLRAAIMEANALGCTPLTINFSITGAINLASALPNLAHPNLTINGPTAAPGITVRRNTGGDYSIFAMNGGTNITLNNLTITNGHTSNGGGILNTGNLTLNGVTLTGNTAKSSGGGLFDAGGTTLIVNSTISGNTATNGAGIAAVNTATSMTAIRFSTITNNLASGSGGGLETGAIHPVTISNTIIAGNTGANGPDVNNLGTLTSQGNNLIGDDTGATITNQMPSDLVGTSGTPLNPQLASLGNYGGPTQTHALLCNSPALNAGNNTGAPAIDQRGILRPQSGIVDIGAFENSLTLGPALPSGQTFAAYNQTLTAMGGTGPYTFALLSGSLPAGLSLAANGAITGTPTAAGTANFIVKATDTTGTAGACTFSITIACSPLTISPTSLPGATLGASYDQTLTVSGGSGTYTFAVTAGTLTPGLTLNANGNLTGTPTTAGGINFTVTATDSSTGCLGTRAYGMTVSCPHITLMPGTLPNGQAGAAYSETVSASAPGLTGTYTFALAMGSNLPPGLMLSAAGQISGTPTQPGAFNFTVVVTHTASGCTGNGTYNVTIGCPTITLSPTLLSSGTAGMAYNQSISALPSGSYMFTTSAGALPAGLTLDANGTLSGTPTVFGLFNFTVRATDKNNCFGEQAYALRICPTLTVNPANLANGFVGTGYSQNVTATGGTAPYSFTISAGTLPSGLTLSTAGALTGTPTTADTFTFTVKATDANGCMGTRTYTIIVSGNGLQFYPLAAPVRLLDTRPGASPNACSQPNAPIAGQTARTQPGRNLCTIPANARALTGNITTVDSGGGFLTLYPSDATQPTVASTNYGVNEVINNVFTVGLGADGAFKIFAFNTTDVVVDVTGYYAPPATGGLFFHPLPAPVRLLETRAGQPVGCVKPGAPLSGGMDSLQTATTACTGIPAEALSVVGNATTVGPQGTGYLTLYPADVPNAPLVASSNYNFNQVVNGPFTVGLSATGQFKIFTTATTDLVVDVLGYYSTEANDVNGAGLLFNPLPHPVRLLETRPGLPVGCFKPGVPLAGGAETPQTARGVCDGVTIPANALGVVGNATIVFPAGAGFLTLWPSTAARPLVATSNYNAGDVGNRHFIVGLSQADGVFKLYTHATTHLVLDLSGYFAP